NHSPAGLSEVTNEGIGSAGPPRLSGPRSAARTRGPHINAAMFLLSGNPSIRRVFGRVRETESPVFHVRFTSTYEPGFASVLNDLPLTLTSNPFPAQAGRRTDKVNCLGFCSVSLRVALSPSGKLVSIATVAPACSHRAVEGTNRFTQR